jgi:hypothetical protein
MQPQRKKELCFYNIDNKGGGDVIQHEYMGCYINIKKRRGRGYSTLI